MLDNKHDINKKKTDITLSTLILSLYNRAKSDRLSLEKLWQQVSYYVRPQDENNSTYEMYDTTAVAAAECLVSGLWGMVSSSAANWFNFNVKQSSNTGEKNPEDTQKWVYQVNKIMKECLLDAESGFYYKSYEFYADLICFGTAIFYIGEDIENHKVDFKSCPLKTTYIMKLYNKVDTVIQDLSFSKFALIEKFGANNIPESILTSNNTNLSEYKVINIVAPVKYFKQNANISYFSDIKFASYYLELSTGCILKKSGYYEFPYMISYWNTVADSLYGKSPAIGVLADIKMLNAISKTIIVAAQKQVDPPILAPNENAIAGIKTNPGGIIYGAVDPVTGATLIKPFNISGDLSYSHELQEQKRETIREAFHNSLLLFSYSSQATATEVLSVNEQKLRILGFKIARIQSEFLYPLLKRMYFVLKRLGSTPEPISEIKNTDIEIQFVGPWNRYQKMVDTIGLKNLQASIDITKQFDNQIVDIINWKEVVKQIAEGNGLSPSIFKSNLDTH